MCGRRPLPPHSRHSPTRFTLCPSYETLCPPLKARPHRGHSWRHKPGSCRRRCDGVCLLPSSCWAVPLVGHCQANRNRINYFIPATACTSCYNKYHRVKNHLASAQKAEICVCHNTLQEETPSVVAAALQDFPTQHHSPMTLPHLGHPIRAPIKQIRANT